MTEPGVEVAARWLNSKAAWRAIGRQQTVMDCRRCGRLVFGAAWITAVALIEIATQVVSCSHTPKGFVGSSAGATPFRVPRVP